MSRSIDERAVIMEFDNDQFEKGIAQSRKSLEEFEKKLQLEGVSKAINNINKQFKNIDFSLIQNSLESIADRFSGFGIVGMTVIQNLTNAVVDFTKGALTNLYNKINEAGKRRALSLEKSRFLLQGILGDEERVADAMKQANDSVDGTAYGLDSAAKAASTFVATGLEGKDLRNALDAVANLTATVSGNYDDISSIVTKIVGSHKLYRNELNSIVSRGFALDEYIVEYIEKVNSGEKKTTDFVKKNIRDMGLLGKKALDVADLTSGANGKLKSISSELVMEVLNDKLEGMAKRANETFTGAIENIGAAWSRIGALFWTPLVEQNSELVKFINAIRVNINAVKAGLEPFATSITNIILKLAEGAKAIAIFTNNNGVESATKSALHLTELFDAMFKIVKPLFDVFEAWLPIQSRIFSGPLIDRINRIIDGFSVWVENGTGAFKVTSNLRYKLDLLAQTLSKALKPLKDFWDMVRYAFYTVFDLGDTTDGIEGFVDVLTDLFKRIDAAYDRWDFRNGIADSFIKIFGTLKTVGESVWRIITAIGEAFADVFIVDGANNTKSFFEWFADILEKLSSYIKVDDEAFGLLKQTFTNIFIAAKGLWEILGTIVSVIVDALPDIMPFVSQLLACAAGIISFVAQSIDAEKVGKALSEVLTFLWNTIQLVVYWIGIAIDNFKEWFGNFKKAIDDSGVLTSVLDLMSAAFEKIKTSLENAPEKIKGFFDSIGIQAPTWEGFTDWLKKAADWINNLKDNLGNFKIGEGFKGFIDLIKSLFSEDISKGSGAGSGAASMSSIGGRGQMMKLGLQLVGETKEATDAIGGNKTIESVKNTIVKYLIPLLNEIPKLAIVVLGIVAFVKAAEILKTIERIKNPVNIASKTLSDIHDTVKSTINKKFVVDLIAAIGLIVVAITGLLLTLNEIVKAGNARTVFITAGVIFALFTAAIVVLLIYINRLIKKIGENKSLAASNIGNMLKSFALIFASIGAMFFLIGQSLKSIAIAFKILPNNPELLFGMFALVLFGILGLIATMAIAQDNMKGGAANSGAFKWWGPTLAAMGLVIESMGKLILICAISTKVDPNGHSIWLAMGLMALLMGLVYVMGLTGEKLKGNEKSLMYMGGALAAVALVFVALAATVGIMIKNLGVLMLLYTQKDVFWKSLGALAVITALAVAAIGGIGAMVFALQKWGNGVDWKLFAGIAIAFAGLAVSVKMLVSALAAIVALMKIDMSAAWEAFKMLALMMGAMLVVIGGLASLAAMAPGGSMAMIVVSAAMITFATAVLILAEALKIGVGTLAEFLLVMDAYSKMDTNKMSKGLTNFFNGLATGFKEALPSIKDFLAQLFTGDIIGMIFDYLIQAFESKVNKIVDSFGRIVDKIHEVLLDKKDKIFEIRDTLYSILFGDDNSSSGFAGGGGMFSGYMGGLEKDTNKTKGLLGGLAEFLKRIFVDTLPGLIVGFFTNIGKLLVDNGDSIKSFWIGAIEGLRDILVAFFKMIGDVIIASADSIITPFYYILGALIAGASDFLVEHHEDILTILGAPFTWLGELLMRHHQDIVDFMIAPFAWITDAVIQGHDTIMAGLGAITTTALEWLGILFHELKGWWEKHWEPDVQPFLYQSFMDTLALALKALEDSTVSITATAVALGLDIIAGIIGGLANGIPKIVEQTMILVDTIKNTVVTEENINHIMDSGAEIVKNFLNGMSEWLEDDKNIDELRASFDRAWEAVIKAIRRFFKMDDSGATQDGSILHQVMHDVIIGLAKGIFIGAGPLIDAVDWLCGQMMGQMTNKDNFDVNSPSKWAKRLGVSIDEGLGLGLKDGSGQLLNSVDELSSDTKSAFSTMMEALKIAGDTEFDIDPTITPVVDISNIEDAAAFANGAFSGIKGGFAFTTNRASALAASIAQNGNGTATVSDGTETATGGVVNFTQNNYSPKSLSHYEIYRQTKNLLHTIDSRK